MTNTQNAMELNKAKKDWLNDDDIEQNIKKYNEKFMETLTMQLTKQLGIDLKKTKEEAENQRRKNVGSSFIEKKPEQLGGNLPEKDLTMNVFGP